MPARRSSPPPIPWAHSPPAVSAAQTQGEAQEGATQEGEEGEEEGEEGEEGEEAQGRQLERGVWEIRHPGCRPSGPPQCPPHSDATRRAGPQDRFHKQQEFYAWLREVRHTEPEVLPQSELAGDYWVRRDPHRCSWGQGGHRRRQATFAEDFNTCTLPDKKYYNLEAWEAKQMARSAQARAQEVKAADASAGAFNLLADQRRVRPAPAPHAAPPPTPPPGGRCTSPPPRAEQGGALARRNPRNAAHHARAHRAEREARHGAQAERKGERRRASPPPPPRPTRAPRRRLGCAPSRCCGGRWRRAPRPSDRLATAGPSCTRQRPPAPGAGSGMLPRASAAAAP